uniref:Uncharacterized protein n=1 Tax=Pygocentrus nattereri TaxID=42514 RepID=A0A3B4E9K5_PYGNA
MAAYGGLRSCTWTEFSMHIFTNSTLVPQSSACAECDLTLLTCLFIGSYRFCIIPLLAAFGVSTYLSSCSVLSLPHTLLSFMDSEIQ